MDSKNTISTVFSKRKERALGNIELEKVLKSFEAKSSLGKPLKNTLRNFEEGLLLSDVMSIAENLASQIEKIVIPEDVAFRIKSPNSIELKLKRNSSDATRSIHSIFNDLLGFRKIVESYSEVLVVDDREIRLVDMSCGKRTDDGYRGVHWYYQASSYHYPIEIQFFTESDLWFNNLLHTYVYKYASAEVGVVLREAFERGLIADEEQFREVLSNEILGR